MTDYSYQSSTGYRYSTYDKYGLFSYRLLSLQNEQDITSKYLETNSITKVVLESQETAMDGIRTALTNIRSQVRGFYSTVLTDTSKGLTEEELSALRNIQEAAFDSMALISYYLNTKVDGSYIFGGGETTVTPVDFPYTNLAEFQSIYDGEILTYPTSYSASLSEMSSPANVLGGVTLEQGMETFDPKTTNYTANTMSFDAATRSLTAQSGTFVGLAENDEVVITGSAFNNGTYKIASVSDDGSTITFNEAVSADELNVPDITVKQGTWEFKSEYSPLTRETTNSLTARAGSFSDLEVGKQILIRGTANNDLIMTIKSISRDSSTVYFEETVTDETINTNALTSLGHPEIEQITQEGYITVGKNIGETIETFEINRGLTVNDTDYTISSGIPGTFSDISGGQTITLTDSSTPTPRQYSVYVKSVSENGDTLYISHNNQTDFPTSDLSDFPITLETRSDIAGFITSSMKGNAAQTGNVSFNVNQNTMTATVKDAFSRYNVGDSLIIKGADQNDKLYIVESISKDGRVMKFSDETPIEVDMNRYSGTFLPNGEGLTICKTYSVGSTVAMNGTDEQYNDLYTVLGISDDGSQMKVRTESFPDNGSPLFYDLASFKTDSYYKGGQMTSTYRISETTAVSNDINASASAFEKVFRALGSIAQGNILRDGDSEQTEQLISDALTLLDEAMTANPNGKNDDIISVQYAIITRLDQVNTTMDHQTIVQSSMESYISAMTQVDKTEAVTMLLQAAEDLKVSYSVLSTINSLSLLN